MRGAGEILLDGRLGKRKSRCHHPGPVAPSLPARKHIGPGGRAGGGAWGWGGGGGPDRTKSGAHRGPSNKRTQVTFEVQIQVNLG